MNFSPQVVAMACSELKMLKNAAEEAQKARLEQVYVKIPRIAQIDQELSLTALKIIKTLGMKNEDEAVDKIRTGNLELQKERREVLVQNGYSPEYLELQYNCPVCEDNGYINQTMCKCMEKLCGNHQKKLLQGSADMKGCGFDKVRIDYYSKEVMPEYGVSARDYMDGKIKLLERYANEFGAGSKSLFFGGSTGLGKSFMATSIAKEVCGKGFYVIYESAFGLFSNLEAEHFNRDSERQIKNRCYFDCDLLVIDDLGTEMTTAFTVAALYNLINMRLVNKKSTIITSNLTSESISSRYSMQIASRLDGDYVKVEFIGKDIRKVKQGL